MLYAAVVRLRQLLIPDCRSRCACSSAASRDDHARIAELEKEVDGVPAENSMTSSSTSTSFTRTPHERDH